MLVLVDVRRFEHDLDSPPAQLLAARALIVTDHAEALILIKDVLCFGSGPIGGEQLGGARMCAALDRSHRNLLGRDRTDTRPVDRGARLLEQREAGRVRADRDGALPARKGFGSSLCALDQDRPVVEQRPDIGERALLPPFVGEYTQAETARLEQEL